MIEKFQTDEDPSIKERTSYQGPHSIIGLPLVWKSGSQEKTEEDTDKSLVNSEKGNKNKSMIDVTNKNMVTEELKDLSKEDEDPRKTKQRMGN